MLMFCLTVGMAEAAPAQPTEQPDSDLLDFLGNWQDEQGRWVDPFTMTDDAPTQESAQPKSNRRDMPADPHARARERPSTPVQDQSRDSLRMPTRP